MKTIVLGCAVSGMLMLTACAQTGETSQTVTIQTVVSQAQVVDGVLDATAPALIATLPAASQTKATLALSSLDAATKALAAGKYDNTKDGVEAFLTADQAVVAVLPLKPSQTAGLEVGIGLIEAFVASLPTPTATSAIVPVSAVTAPTAPTTN